MASALIIPGHDGVEVPDQSLDIDAMSDGPLLHILEAGYGAAKTHQSVA